MAPLPFFAPSERAVAQAPATQHTVGELLTMYAQDMLPARAPNTQYQHRLVYRMIHTDLGHILLRDLTPGVLRHWRDTLRHRGLKPGSVRRYLDTLSGPLTSAVRDYELLAENPLRKVRYPAHSPGRVRYLTPAERQRLLSACQASRCKALFPLVVLALATGARKMELLTLRWSDVDLGQGTIRLLHTKNKTARSVPVVGTALEVLRAWHQRLPAGTHYVFPSYNGTKGRHITTAWYNALRRAGLPNFRFHDLRHTCASWLAMSGATLRDIAAILGHKDLNMSLRYSHLTDPYMRAVVQRMAEAFLGASPAPPAEDTPPPAPTPHDIVHAAEAIIAEAQAATPTEPHMSIELQILELARSLAPLPASAIQVAGMLALPIKRVRDILQDWAQRGTLRRISKGYYRITS